MNEPNAKQKNLCCSISNRFTMGLTTTIKLSIYYRRLDDRKKKCCREEKKQRDEKSRRMNPILCAIRAHSLSLSLSASLSLFLCNPFNFIFPFNFILFYFFVIDVVRYFFFFYFSCSSIKMGFLPLKMNVDFTIVSQPFSHSANHQYIL